MKKLMIAAAATAMVGGVYAAGSTCGEAEINTTYLGTCGEATIAYETEACLVWDLTLKVKTLAPKKLVCKGCKYNCDDNTTVSYLDDTTRTFNGYAWICDDQCETLAGDGPFFALWEKASKTPVVPLFYNILAQGGSSMTVAQDPEKFATWELYRYGKKATKVAAYWDYEGSYEECPVSLYAAGVKGTGTKNLYMYDGVADDDTTGCYGLLLKSISGSVVGHWPVTSLLIKKCDGVWAYPILTVDMCDCFSSWCDIDDEFDGLVPALGTWTMKQNTKVAKGGKSMLNLVPSYALVER